MLAFWCMMVHHMCLYELCIFDGQNVYLAIRDCSWHLDWQRLRIFLREKYNVEKALLFLGYLPKHRSLYTSLKRAGFTLVFKPVIRDRDGIVKGNVDAELVLHCAKIEFDHYDKAIVVSGDGDFHCLIAFLQEQGKLLKIGIPNKRKFSASLRPFRAKHMFYISDLRRKLEKR